MKILFLISALFLIVYITGLDIFVCTSILFRKAEKREDVTAMQRAQTPFAVGMMLMKIGLSGMVISFIGVILIHFQ